MQPREALAIVEQVTGKVTADRATHQTIMRAIAVLAKTVTEHEATHATHDHPADPAIEHSQPEQIRDGAGAG